MAMIFFAYILTVLFSSVTCRLAIQSKPSAVDITFQSHHDLLPQPSDFRKSGPQNSLFVAPPGPKPTLSQPLNLRAQPTTVFRPRSLEAFHSARLHSLHHGESQHMEWDPLEVLGPDVEDIHTLAQLARMTGNAYALPGQKNWYDIDPAWNTVSSTEFRPA